MEAAIASSQVTRFADSHIHLFASGYPGQYGAWFPGGREVPVYEAIRGVHGIERALVVGYEGEPWAAGNNAYIARLAREKSWIAPLAFCAAAKPVSARQFANWWNAGFCGISLYLMQREDVQGVLNWPEEIFAALNDKRAIISINVPLANVEHLRPFFTRLPDTRILISHLGSPGRVSAETSESAARKLLAPLTDYADISHLGVKVSGFYVCSDFPHQGMAPMVETLRQSFGDKRLYWGSDFSPALDTVTFAQSIEAARTSFSSAAPQKAVFYANLQRIIGRVRSST